MKNKGATQSEVLSWCNNFKHFSMLVWSGESVTSSVERLTWLFKPCGNVFCEPAEWFIITLLSCMQAWEQQPISKVGKVLQWSHHQVVRYLATSSGQHRCVVSIMNVLTLIESCFILLVCSQNCLHNCPLFS